ncbi:hypothetical protein, partial [Bacillus sp. JCM 19041]
MAPAAAETTVAHLSKTKKQ